MNKHPHPKEGPIPTLQQHVLIKGRVQGVGFRVSLLNEALKYSNLKGYVRNLKDGRVEAVFSGNKEDVLSLSAWCRQGPPQAEVKEIEITDEPVNPLLDTFDIIKTA